MDHRPFHPVPGRARGAIALLLAIDAEHGERHRPQPFYRDIFAALRADAVKPLLKPVKGEVDRLKPFLRAFDQAGMSLDLGKAAGGIDLVAGGRQRVVLLLAAQVADALKGNGALMFENALKLLDP